MARRNLCFRSSRSSPSSVSCKDSISGGTMTVSTDCDQHPWGNSRLRWWTTRWLHRCSLLVRPRRLPQRLQRPLLRFRHGRFRLCRNGTRGACRRRDGQPAEIPADGRQASLLAHHTLLHCLSGPCGAFGPVHRAASAQRKGVVGCQSFSFRHRHQ